MRPPRHIVPSLCLAAFGFGIVPSQGDETEREFDRFGGFRGVAREATGFFRVEEVENRWWFITPEGYPYIPLGGNHVGNFLKTQAGESGLLARHLDDPEAAAEALLESLRNLGLNAGDAYQPDRRFAERIQWVKSFHYFPGKNQKWFNVFDPNEVKAVKAQVTAECASIADNPWVLGVAGPDLPRWDSSYAHPYRMAEPGSLARTGYEEFL
ncbi:MAG: hypothetical protein AAGF67_13340, partial [Verrucomicrobiota bacterium]